MSQYVITFSLISYYSVNMVNTFIQHPGSSICFSSFTRSWMISRTSEIVVHYSTSLRVIQVYPCFWSLFILHCFCAVLWERTILPNSALFLCCVVGKNHTSFLEPPPGKSPSCQMYVAPNFIYTYIMCYTLICAPVLIIKAWNLIALFLFLKYQYWIWNWSNQIKIKCWNGYTTHESNTPTMHLTTREGGRITRQEMLKWEVNPS